jgi:hypothetical protein
VRDLSQDEGLDMESCTAVDASTMICTDAALAPISDTITTSQIVFACEGTTDLQLQAVVTLEEDALDCSQTPFGVEAYSRSVSLAAICPTEPGFVQFPFYFQDPGCSEGAEVTTLYSCSLQGSCTDTPTGFELPGDNGPCSNAVPLQQVAISVSEAGIASLLPACFWSPVDVSTGRVQQDEVNDAVLASDTLEAVYEVVLTGDSGVSAVGDSCLFAEPSVIDVSCGVDGALVSDDLESTPACRRVDDRSFQCTLDANEFAGVNIVTSQASCRGTTRTALALDVLWDPQEMECTSTGSDVATVSYTMFLQQLCESGDYANIVAQQCSPISATDYEADFDSTEEEGVGTEFCSLLHSNCHLSSQCSAGTGRQELGRLRAFMPPDMVDVGCAGGDGATINGGVDGSNGSDEGVNNDNSDGGRWTRQTLGYNYLWLVLMSWIVVT